MSEIVVIGSSNTDLVVYVEELPQPGQTVLGHDLREFLGGKGANQAVAARRLGAEVAYIARIGTDAFGQGQVKGLTAEGLDPAHFLRDDPGPSGLALISLDRRGQNSIVVAAGSNGRLCEADLEKKRPLIESAKLVLLEMEIPVATV